MIRSIFEKSAILFLLTFSFTLLKATDQPFALKADLFDQSQTDDLGLSKAEGTETITVFYAEETTDKFCNGVVMIGFKDSIYCQWQSSANNEDALDTWVAYSASKDGKTWTKPRVLAPTLANGYCSSGGWWINGDTLVAYINTWPNLEPRGGYTRYIASTDGVNWTDPKAVTMLNGDTLKGIFEQDPRAITGGRIINSAHFQPGLIANPIYTDDSSGVRGWVRPDFTNTSISGDISQEIEPSCYQRSDGAIVMIFRDQNSSFLKLASVSYDSAETWSPVVVTDMLDARTKQSAGNIADSAVYMVGNPNDDKLRTPLAITLSSDGIFFNTAYVLLEDSDSLPADPRYSGTAKRKGFHYPKTMIWHDTLYASFAYYKEDVMFTRVPLKSLMLDTTKPRIVLDDAVAEFGASSEIKSFNVTSTVVWSLAENSSWILTNKLNNNTMQISCAENTTTDQRQDTVYVTAPFTDTAFIVVKQDGATISIDNTLDNNDTFKILNGADNSLIIQNDALIETAVVSIYNLNGQKVYEGKMNGNELFIDLSNKASGSYVLRICSDNENFSRLIFLR